MCTADLDWEGDWEELMGRRLQSSDFKVFPKEFANFCDALTLPDDADLDNGFSERFLSRCAANPLLLMSVSKYPNRDNMAQHAPEPPLEQQLAPVPTTVRFSCSDGLFIPNGDVCGVVMVLFVFRWCAGCWRTWCRR